MAEKQSKHEIDAQQKEAAKRELMAKGDEAFDADEYEKALDFYHRATVLDGQDVQAWNALGLTYYNLDFPREAWRSYKLALHVDPDNLDALWYAAEFLYNMEDYLLAKAFLTRYLEREVDPERLSSAKTMLEETEIGIAKSQEEEQADDDEEDEEPDDEDLPEGFEVEDDEDEDDEDEDYLDDDELMDDEDETFVATLTLQLEGTDARCQNCSTRIPLDAPYCYHCLAPHFYEEA